MDKRIVDKLVKFGLITNVGVDASKYKDTEDLIAKGIITIPGARDKINALLTDLVDSVEEDDNTLVVPTPEPQLINEVINEDLDDKSPVIDETPETEPVINETPEIVEPIDDTVKDNSPVIDETPESEPELVVEEANNEVAETVEEPVKKTRKSKKTE